LSGTSVATLKTILGKNKIFFIDEAQRSNNIGLTLKLITDEVKDVQVIATGSSAFELSNRLMNHLRVENMNLCCTL
jgi:predicted AAA+ superfamily ATPase